MLAAAVAMRRRRIVRAETRIRWMGMWFASLVMGSSCQGLRPIQLVQLTHEGELDEEKRP